MVSTIDGLLPGVDYLTPPAAVTANSEAQYTLLLNNTGNAAFSIPGGDDSVIQTVVRRKEFNRTSSVAAPTISTTGYDLYTRDSNNVVEKFSFSIDGVLESQTPTTLSGFALLEAEAIARTDLSATPLLGRMSVSASSQA